MADRKSDICRKKLDDLGVRDALYPNDMDVLRCYIEKLLKFHRKKHDTFYQETMRLSRYEVTLHDDGRVKEAFLRVRSDAFDGEREAFTFNADGFVGIAGWADSKNEVPFIEAFGLWLGYLAPTADIRRSHHSLDLDEIVLRYLE